MKKETLEKFASMLGMAFAIFGPIILLPIINDCFSGWFGTEGGFLHRIKWKIAAIVSCNILTLLSTCIALRQHPNECLGFCTIIIFTFIWSVIVGIIYYTLII